MAASLAQASNHPLSRALAAAHREVPPAQCMEFPGAGVEATIGDAIWRLGNAPFCGGSDDGSGERSRVWLARNGEIVAAFEFDDDLRDDAPATVAELRRLGVTISILSGDRRGSVDRIATRLGIAHASHGLTPQAKDQAIQALRLTGSVGMVGDGINDAVALRAADVSFAPAAAADVGRAAADFVLTNDRLSGVPFAIWLAQRADILVRQNLALSMAYNVVVLPLAVAGHVTPLIAAIAMSSSSIIVVLNALRLRLERAPILSGNLK